MKYAVLFIHIIISFYLYKYLTSYDYECLFNKDEMQQIENGVIPIKFDSFAKELFDKKRHFNK